MIFFTSDTHFGHKRTLELSRRPFESVESMDSFIINNWNLRIDSNDTIYHLGDFGNVEILQYLNGNVVFLPGNYDCEDIVKELSKSCKIIKPNTVLEIENKTFQLIHEPDEGQFDYISFFLFGHIHKLQMVKQNGLNVGVDCHNFCPISSKAVLFYRNAIQNYYDKNVFMERIGK